MLTSGLLALLAVTACVPPPPLASNETTTTIAPATTAPPTTTTTTVPTGGFTCPTWTATSGNTATDSRIQEASGLAASRVNGALWWVHNDGPNAVGQVVSPTLYGLDASGATVSTIDLNGATDVDWEDVDEVTIGGASTIWVADVGDNPKARPSVQLYRFVEPVVPAGQGVTVTPDVINLTYPNGAKHNVETTFVDPTNGDYYLVTKEVPPLVFRIPAALARRRRHRRPLGSDRQPRRARPQHQSGRQADRRRPVRRRLAAGDQDPGADVHVAPLARPDHPGDAQGEAGR